MDNDMMEIAGQYPKTYRAFLEVHHEMGYDVTPDDFWLYVRDVEEDAAIDRFNDRE